MLAGATQTSVTLRWKAPGNNGGADVQAYEAEIQPRTQNAIQAGMDMEWNTVFQVFCCDAGTICKPPVSCVCGQML